MYGTHSHHSHPTLPCFSLLPLSIPAPCKSLSPGAVFLFCDLLLLLRVFSVTVGLGLSHGAWRVHLWAHSWRQWLFSPPSDLWALPHPRRTVGRSNLVRARARHYRCCDFMIAIAMSSPEDGICGRLPVFWFSHPFCSVSCSLPEP